MQMMSGQARTANETNEIRRCSDHGFCVCRHMRISATTTEMMQNTCDWHVALVCSKYFHGSNALQ